MHGGPQAPTSITSRPTRCSPSISQCLPSTNEGTEPAPHEKSFRLEDCADDVIRVADALGIDELIGVGYSMGGTIAQLLWKQHPTRVNGLVLCATAPYFSERREERLSFMGLNGLATLARLTPGQARDWFSEQFYLQRKSESWGPWAVAQAAQHDWRMVLEAGHAVGQFSSLEWAHTVDVPTAVIVTLDDPVVPKSRQIKLLELILKPRCSE